MARNQAVDGRGVGNWCLGCETGCEGSHWHDPIPRAISPWGLAEWWCEQQAKYCEPCSDDDADWAVSREEEAAHTIQSWWFMVRMHPESAALTLLEDRLSDPYR